MQPIAAYYVFAATEIARERDERLARYVSSVPQRTLLDRLTAVVETLVRSTRTAASAA